jgi:hypothetical protein
LGLNFTPIVSVDTLSRDTIPLSENSYATLIEMANYDLEPSPYRIYLRCNLLILKILAKIYLTCFALDFEPFIQISM